MQVLLFKLNYNYKKVDVSGDDGVSHVAVLAGESFEHYRFRGIITLDEVFERDGHLSAFFAKGGFKKAGDYGFTYPDGSSSIIAYVEGKSCWAVVNSDCDTPIIGSRYDAAIASKSYWL
jgi:hypothetical protein